MHKWVYDSEHEWFYCSNCKEHALVSYNDLIDLYEDLLTPYCPFCGQHLSNNYRKVVCVDGSIQERTSEN